jgi:GT2 family glycosyltransferase
VGIRAALSDGAELVFLVNNDTIAGPNLLSALAAQLDVEVGVLGPVIYYASDPHQIWSQGGQISPYLLEMTGDHGRGQPVPDEPSDREFLSGCAMLVRRAVFERAGLFDERFFMYYEDLDFCVRVRDQRFKLRLVPDASLWHKVSQSSGGSNSPQERYAMAYSSGVYFRKHMRSWRIPLILTYRLLSAFRWTARMTVNGSWHALRAYWRGLLNGWLST